ncbi:unnamed protein product [Rotaria socialis]|uniref:Tetratricopeptide repeat protein n=1 Tax=Rotaria socialis TaxID=392032 RepID=A0A818CHE4_9BILA|nr:unnamed protein product [Rotaria socialis]
MKEEIDGGGWYRMGQLIPRMGYFDQAEELSNELLENSRLGTALKVLQNAYQIQEKTFQEGNQAFASTFSWYGSVYRDLKEYSKALDYFEKCLTIVRKTLPENHPDFGLTYSNIGDIHHLMGDYEKALAFHHKALNIQEKVKRNPLKCATTYTN